MPIDVESFQQGLRLAGAYVSAPRLSRAPPRRNPWRTLRYHIQIMRTIVASDRKAREGRFDRRAWLEAAVEMLRVAESWGAELHFEGFGPAAAMTPPKVFVANHMSAMETFALPGALLTFGDVCVVLKRSLLRYPVFGPTVKATEPIAVTRTNPRADLEHVLTEGRRMLAAGRSVLIFPEVKRMRVFDPARFNSIGVKLSGRAGVPLIPVAVRTDFAGVGRILREFGPVRPEIPVRFAAGAPIATDIPPRERQARAVTFIAGKLKAWGIKERGERS